MVTDNLFAVANKFPRPRLAVPTCCRDIATTSTKDTSIPPARDTCVFCAPTRSRTLQIQFRLYDIFFSANRRIKNIDNLFDPHASAPGTRVRIEPRSQTSEARTAHAPYKICQFLVSPRGIEPLLQASEARVLSVELRGQILSGVH